MIILETEFLGVPLHIPDTNGDPYKTQLILNRTPSQTTKINWWHKADNNRGDVNLPHNHPWPFRSKILQGGYTEDVYWLVDGVVYKETYTYKEGDINICPLHIFHMVVDIKPNTISMMICGAEVANRRWGYLDPKTGKYQDAVLDPNYLKNLKENNKFLR